MSNFISMHSFGNMVVDYRKLQIEVHFSSATRLQVINLIKYCVISCEELLENAFFLEWKVNSRIVKRPMLFANIEQAKEIRSVDFYGNVLTSPYNNHKALIKYNRDLFNDLTLSNAGDGTSIDYWPVYHRLFDDVSDTDSIRRNLLKLFSIEDVYCKQTWFGEDVVGHVFACPYFQSRDLYYGHFEFRIAVPCLSNDLVSFSNKSADFITKLTGIIPDVFGHVMLSPNIPPSSCSSYMSYFGSNCQIVPPCKPSFMRNDEWIKSYFLRGIEWYNLLSPIQTKILDNKSHPDEITKIALPNGGSGVSINKSILQTKLSDLCMLKNYLYPVLFPGSRKISVQDFLDPHKTGPIAKLRCCWENIPVLEKELSVSKEFIVLRHLLD